MFGSVLFMSICCLICKVGWFSCGVKRLMVSSGVGIVGFIGIMVFMRMGCVVCLMWYRVLLWWRVSDMNSCFYQGVLCYCCLQLKVYYFVYCLFMIWFDFDELDRLFEVGICCNCLVVVVWYDVDYLLGVLLKVQVLNWLESLIGCCLVGCVMFLIQLCYFGFYFNLVNFYYCYDEVDILCWVLVEVCNMLWNECYYYVVDGQQVCLLEKVFYVLLFNLMDMVYYWCFNVFGKMLYMYIENYQVSKVFDVILVLSCVLLICVNLCGLLLCLLLMILKIVFVIYWQVLWLWLKCVLLYNYFVSRSECL